LEVVSKSQKLPKVHPRVEVVEDKARLSGRPRHGSRDQHALRYLRLVQTGCGLEVSRRRGLRRVEPPGEDPRLHRFPVVAGDSQDVAVPAVIVGTPAGRVNPAGLDPGLAVGGFWQLVGQAGLDPLRIEHLGERTLRIFYAWCA